MKTLESIEYLVIDEFGSEFKSDYVRDQIVLPLLSERSKEHRITFFASDYSLEEIEELYGAKYGGRLIAKKLVSLIKNNLDPKAECHVERGLENMLSR
jgi:primosomal protein DnaI